jgi:predicted Zn finger-like uncharacterized protein
MLVTTCAHCQSRFRVTPQELNARQGQVRCGRCRGVFNGFQALERFPDDDTGGRLLAEQEARAAAEQEATETAESFESSPPVPADAGEMPDLETVEDARPVPPPKPAAPPPAPAKPARFEPDLLLEPPPKAAPSRAWSFGVALLSVVLLAELAFAFRGPVAQRYPALRPSLEAACVWLKCSVPYAREDGLLKLEDSELLEVPGKPNEIALGARIRNLASVAQEYPHLELTLTDNSGQPAARRVLRPTDYLGRPLAAGEVIGPGVELALQMRLETPRLKATGYELLFYP